ncbi:MAG: SAM-dependent methyltransferase [Bacteroidales bacterium]|nr:SAM-dependent methyltransferase [Bacteroidales bacterium]
MKIFDANISILVADFFTNKLLNVSVLKSANELLQYTTGIKSFFSDESELIELNEKLSISLYSVKEPDRGEYGDFQTNRLLANKVANRLHEQGINPEIIIEPTCGKGNFIVASLNNFIGIKQIIGIEIYKTYVWETKFNILDFFLKNPKYNKPSIEIFHYNVFDFDFKTLSNLVINNNLLIIGNPPWVTNSQLGSLNSNNLPKKSNFKNQNGLDAMTGKGNFDIAEYITLSLFDAFQCINGHLALLIKNSVVKNIVFNQKAKQYRIGSIEKHCINSKKEFNVSVESSLLFCKLNSSPEFECKEYNFYNKKMSLCFGWVNNKFVSNTANYIHTQSIDGICSFEWRQGIKHDCSAVMELEKTNEYYLNNLKENVVIEDELVFGLLKSSDLKNTVINKTRKYTIVTQRKVGQETNYIKYQFPETYKYLYKHLSVFQSRKSSIYKGKPLFSIFGIGDYSFKPYKVAISGLYKTFHFTLVLPQNDKPVMLDDTCYFIGFENIEYAVYAIILLNSPQTEDFLRSITFSDAKRVFTKDILMRIDLLKLTLNCSKQYIEEQLQYMNDKYNFNLDLKLWDNFIEKLTPIKEKQMTLF